MDFTNLLNAVENFLYELASWVIFYPITLFRSAVRPLQMLRYAERELDDQPGEQYDDTLSPPIFLVITLLLAHVLQSNLAPAVAGAVPDLLRDERNLLLFRAIAFSLFPLILGFQTVRARRIKLTRKSLRPAFFGQCFVASPFILVAYAALTVGLHGGNAIGAALLLALADLIWYGAVQCLWFRSLGAGWLRAIAVAIGSILVGMLAILAFSAATVGAFHAS